MLITVETGNTQTVELKRTVGLTTACSLIIGGIIGSGIFVSPQGVLEGAGSYGFSLVVWAVCGVMSLCGALTYAEMGTIIPKSGSGYYYIMEVYGDCAAFVYMFTWAFFILPSGLAIVALTCSQYVILIFFQDQCGTAPEDIVQILATSILLLFTFINIRSVSMSGKISVIFTVAKMAALVVIVIGGVVKMSQGFTENLNPSNSFHGTSTSVASIAEAFISGMWAFSGWEGLNYMIEEAKNPNRNLPLAIYISIPMVTIVYLLTNVSYFTVMSQDDFSESIAVAVTWASYVIPKVFWFVPLSVALSTFGATCSSLMLNSRLIFVAAREDHLLEILAMIHVKYLTPFPAVVLLSVLSIMYQYLGNINQLIGYTGIAVWFFHGMVGVALLKLRLTKRDVIRPYKAPLICPVVLIVFATVLTFGPVIGNPQWGYFFAIGVLVTGALLWLILVKFRFKIPGLENFTRFIQLLTLVTAPESTTAETSTADKSDTNANKMKSRIREDDLKRSCNYGSFTTEDSHTQITGASKQLYRNEWDEKTSL